MQLLKTQRKPPSVPVTSSNGDFVQITCVNRHDLNSSESHRIPLSQVKASSGCGCCAEEVPAQPGMLQEQDLGLL